MDPITSGPEIVSLGAPDAVLGVVAFPHAGAGVAALYPLATKLREHRVAVHVVRLPGRETRIDEPPYERVEELTEALVPAVEPLGRCVLFGHSTGALFAFLLARRLAGTVAEPLALAVSGRRAPHLAGAGAPMHALPDAQFLAAVERLVGEPVPELHDDDLWEVVEPALRADIAMDERYAYIPGPALPCPITVLAGMSATNVPPAELQAWQLHTTAAFAQRRVPGGHFYLQTNPAEVAAALRDESPVWPTAEYPQLNSRG